MNRRGIIILLILSSFGIWMAGCDTSPTPTPLPKADKPPVEEVIPQVMVEDIPQVTEAAVTESEPSEPENAVNEMTEALVGLPLDEFFETSFRILMLRSPETVLSEGLADFYSLSEVTLNNISDEYLRETYKLQAAILEILSNYNRESLTPEDRISYDIYKWYLEDELARQDFMYHDYPATYYFVTAIHEDLLLFFSDLHPVSDTQDAQDYVTRLGKVSTKIDQLIEGLEIRVEAGITPPEYSIQWSVYGSLGSFVDTPAKYTQLYTSFKEKMDPLSSITPVDQKKYLKEAERIIQDEVLPAYQKLHTYLSRLDTYSGENGGVWRLPQGDAYYSQRLKHFTTTNISADEIHQLGLRELDRIHGEMRTIFDQLDYPQDQSITTLYDRVAQDGGRIPGSQVQQTYEDLISKAEENLIDAFDIRPEADVIVIPDQYGGYYISASLDGSRPGAFYANVSGTKDYYAMPTLTHHETVPGHHFQIALAQELEDLPSFRQGLGFSAYTEGWALYAEHLAGELGWYDDDLYGYLGLLQSQAFRAARLVVDTGLHAKGWTFVQAQSFFTENTGFEVGDNVNPQYEIARYLVWPGQSVSYYVGYLKFIELRQGAMDALGENFDLKEFHQVVLNNGSMPLEILEKVVEQYILEKLNS